MRINFEHQMAAHCENGVVANLLRFYGIHLSEAMVFGIGSGIFFTYLPFIKLGDAPAFAFRPLPGHIFKKATKSLGVKIHTEHFRNPDKAMQSLDANLSKGIPTGMVVGVYFLPYFPPQYRFHFNAHNIVAIGKEDGRYLISDPVMEGIETLGYDELKKVRYAKGFPQPQGKMYYITKAPQNADIEKAVLKGIKNAVLYMVKLPGPVIGVTGMKYLGNRVKKWPQKFGPKKASRYLGQIVRMQEEIGTGGAGFRFLYAAFLQEAAGLLQSESMDEISKQMTRTGDKWRDFAVAAGRLCKGRETTESYDQIGDLLIELSEDEKQIFLALDKVVKGFKK